MPRYGLEAFVDGQRELYRPPGLPGQSCGNRLGFDIQFSTVSAAHIRHDDTNPAERQTKDSRKMIAKRERILTRGPYGELFAVVAGDIDVRFERIMLYFLKAKGVFENVIRLSEGFVYIAPAEAQVITDVGAVESWWRSIGRAT